MPGVGLSSMLKSRMQNSEFRPQFSAYEASPEEPEANLEVSTQFLGPAPTEAPLPVGPRNFFGMSQDDLRDFLKGLGKEQFRAQQIFKWVYEKRITDFVAHDLIIRATDVGVCSNRLIPAVLNQWREPKHEQFERRNVWSLFNGFTAALKQGSLADLPKRTEALHALLDSHVGLAQKFSRN